MIHTISLVFATLCFAGMIACFFMLIRNRWVFNARKKILYSDFTLYKKLPEYDEMMRRFWVWNIKDFLP